MSDFLLADAAAVVALESAEDQGGEDRESAQHIQRLVDAVDHLPLVGVAGGNEERGGQPGRRDAEADGHLLHGAGDGAGAAGLFARVTSA